MDNQNNKMAIHVQAFAKLLIALRTELGNDLDSVLILAVISECHFASVSQRSCSDTETLTATNTTRGINTLSVALYTEMPRETVRRKVAKLIKKGWVKRDEQGNLSPTPQAASDLEKGTAATLDYLSVIS